MAFAQTVHPQPVSEQVQYPFGKHELTEDFFPCLKADYEDGLGMDAEVPGLGFDFLDWGAAPALLDDDQIDACTPLATLSDESDDTLLINSASTSTLDSSCSGSGSDTPDVEAAAVVPTITSSVAGPAVPQAPRTCRALQPRVWLLSGDAYESTMTRKERVQRYREKRKRRTFGKTIRYEARRAYAEVRPRIKGRFATKAEVAAMKLAAEAGIPFEC